MRKRHGTHNSGQNFPQFRFSAALFPGVVRHFAEQVFLLFCELPLQLAYRDGSLRCNRVQSEPRFQVRFTLG